MFEGNNAAVMEKHQGAGGSHISQTLRTDLTNVVVVVCFLTLRFILLFKAGVQNVLTPEVLYSGSLLCCVLKEILSIINTYVYFYINKTCENVLKYNFLHL